MHRDILWTDQTIIIFFILDRKRKKSLFLWELIEKFSVLFLRKPSNAEQYFDIY